MERHIFLIGFMGAGKSSVARMLCRKYGVSCVEMDQAIVEKEGMPITDIFEKHGEAYFRQLETDCLLALCEKEACVVSCGGGTVLKEENVTAMKAHGRIFLLSATPETILERVKDSKDRPLLNGHMNTEYIAELMEKRRECYEKAADTVIETDGKSVDAISEEILEVMRE